MVPDGVTRGQFLGFIIGRHSQASQIMFRCRPRMASSLKHTPHQACCASKGPRCPSTTWFSSSSGLHLLGLPRPHPAFGSITPNRGRAHASRERKRQRKPEGGARFWPRSSPSPADTPRLAKTRAERGKSLTPQPRAGAIGAAGRRSRPARGEADRKPGRQAASQASGLGPTGLAAPPRWSRCEAAGPADRRAHGEARECPGSARLRPPRGDGRPGRRPRA